MPEESLRPFRKFLTLLACWPGVASAQLPPPDLLLTEPRPAVLMLGPLDVHLRANTSVTYDDNINLHELPEQTSGIVTRRDQAPTGDDFITTIAPGIKLTKSSMPGSSPGTLALDYSPSFVFFARNPKENSIDHAERFDAGYGFAKLTLALIQDYSSTAGGVIDVGTRVSQENHRVGGTIRYELTEKTYLLTDASYRLTDYETQTDSEDTASTTTLNYQYSPKLTVGLGVSFGLLSVNEQTQFTFTNAVATNTVTRSEPQTQTYAGPTVRAVYKTTEKTALEVSVGTEWRWYPGGGTAFNPVFSLSGSYHPFSTTSFRLEGHRREQNSAVVNGANFITTGVSFSLRQQLRERWSGTFSFTYDNMEYVSASRGASPNRSDDYFLLRYGLEAILGRSWTVGIFHQYREDISTDPSFSFSNNQVGVQASWQL